VFRYGNSGKMGNSECFACLRLKDDSYRVINNLDFWPRILQDYEAITMAEEAPFGYHQQCGA
jgi:hypothetical protein